MAGGITSWILRGGVAFAFLYPPFNALSQPDAWIGYFPSFVQDMAASANVSNELLLHAFGVIEVVVALWILSGFKIFWPCMLAAAMLVGIVAFNAPEFQVLFRDLSIAAAAVALAFYSKESKNVTS